MTDMRNGIKIAVITYTMALADLHKTLQTYGHKVSGKARQLQPRYHPATVHNFRVAVKKLRAILRWLAMDKKITTKDFRKIYHAAGSIRNLQVLLKHIRTKKIMLPAFEEWLNTRLANDKKQWKKIYTKTITHQLEKKITKIKTVTRPQWLLSKKTELRSILKNPTDIALHEVRKIYKDLQYIEEWAQKNKMAFPAAFPGELAKNGKRLGQYHDRVIAVEYITKYIQQEKVKAAKKEAEIQQKKWVTQKANQKKTLLRSLSNSF